MVVWGKGEERKVGEEFPKWKTAGRGKSIERKVPRAIENSLLLELSMHLEECAISIVTIGD